MFHDASAWTKSCGLLIQVSLWVVMWIGSEGYSAEYSKLVSHFPKQTWLNSSLQQRGVRMYSQVWAGMMFMFSCPGSFFPILFLFLIFLSSSLLHLTATLLIRWGFGTLKRFLEVSELMMMWLQQGKGQGYALWFLILLHDSAWFSQSCFHALRCVPMENGACCYTDGQPCIMQKGAQEQAVSL